jgi:hypothetical protein
VIFVTQRALSRRTLLRGVGAAVSLPLLSAMVPALAAAPSLPRRIGFIYMPNGVAMNFTGVDYWTPKGLGREMMLSPILAPLEPFRERVSVVSGLTHHQADALDDGANGDHTRATSSWLTGAHSRRTEGADVETGVSADQVAARVLGSDTALPSLELGIDQNFLSGQCENGYSCIYLNTLAWRTPTSPLPTEINPRLVFERLFGDGGTVEQRAALAQENRSLLDSVTEEITRLSRRIGPADRRQVDDFVESVRAVERRIQAIESLTDDTDVPPMEKPHGIPENFENHVKLMYELQWLAFRSDLTRVTTFMLGRELNFRTYPEIGINEGHHGLSHHQDRAEQLEKLARLNAYQTSLFAWFLEKLRSTPEGDERLLDRSLFLYGAGLSNPNLHAHVNLPLAVVGGAANQHKGGQHVAFPEHTPMSNLLLSMLDMVGAPSAQLGDSSGPLAI